jgi:hypothetical protein
VGLAQLLFTITAFFFSGQGHKMSYQFQQIVNPGLLAEELDNNLGYTVTVGYLDNAGSVSRTDGLDFSEGDINIINTTLTNHDDGLSSESETNNQALQSRREDAKARLYSVGSAGIRVTGLPDLADIVADIVEALELDL